MREALEALRTLGDSRLKKYEKPIPEDQFVRWGCWLISYVKEEVPVLPPQRTLAVSREDGGKFRLGEFMESTGSVVPEVFGNMLLIEGRDFPRRGFTWVIVLDDRESSGEKSESKLE